MNAFHSPQRSPLASSLIILAFFTPWLQASPPQVTIKADHSQVELGQPVLVMIRVRGCDSQPDVQPPQVPHCDISLLGTPRIVPGALADLYSQSLLQPQSKIRGEQLTQAMRLLSDRMSQLQNSNALDPNIAKMINDPTLMKDYQQALASARGLQKNDYIFYYQVQPEHTGLFTLPSFVVNAGGQTIETKPVSVSVLEPHSQSWVRVQVTLANPTPLVGEEVPLYIDLLVQRQPVSYGGRTFLHLPLKDMHLSVPNLERQGLVELARPLETVAREAAVPAGHRGMRINAIPIEMKPDYEPAGYQGSDPRWYRRRLTVPLRFVAPGSVVLQPIRASGSVFLPNGGLNRGRWEAFVASSEPLSIPVIDVRGRTDRPKDFIGAVGPLKITAQTSQTQMAVGTPFPLSVRVEGERSVSQAVPPDLASRPEFTQRFRVRLDKEHTVSDQIREFTYTLRPTQAGSIEVPPIRVSYLDPRSNQFVAVQSQPIPLQVTPGGPGTPSVAMTSPAEPASPPATLGAEDEVEKEDLFSIENIFVWIEGALAAVVVGSLLFLGRQQLRQRQGKREQDQQRRQALAMTEQQLQAKNLSFMEVRQLLHDFLRARFKMPQGEITPLDAAQYLCQAGIEERLAHACADLLQTCETAAFAPGLVNGTSGEAAAQAKRLIADLAAVSLPTQPSVKKASQLGGKGLVTVSGS